MVQTRSLYAGANRMTATRLAVLDLPEGNAMRAPGEAPGMMALEIAMDEMAEKLGLDPVEFRIINDTQVVPTIPASGSIPGQGPTSRPPCPSRSASSSNACGPGAERFGWEQAQRRSPARSATDAGWSAWAWRRRSATISLMKSAARVRLDSRGIVTVETDMTDIGTGSYTIIAQTAAEMMGVPLEQGGRCAWATRPSRSRAARAASGAATARPPASMRPASSCARPWRRRPASTRPTPSSLTARSARASRSVPLARGSRRRTAWSPKTSSNSATSTRSTSSRPSARISSKWASTQSTGETRVRRMLAVCAAGRILNPKTARSQVIGAMTMGVGAALMEELAVDKRLGFFVNHDLAGYEVPVHADIPHQEVIFLDETDPMSSPMKAKGVGELGICGVGRGRRQRDLQRHRRARARLSDHAGQAPRRTAGDANGSTVCRHFARHRLIAGIQDVDPMDVVLHHFAGLTGAHARRRASACAPQQDRYERCRLLRRSAGVSRVGLRRRIGLGRDRSNGRPRWRVRSSSAMSAPTLFALACLIGTQVAFWTLVFPGNRQTHDWTVAPANWDELRLRWEIGHAVSAILILAALVALLAGLLRTDPLLPRNAAPT